MNKIDHNFSRSFSQNRLPTQSELYIAPKTQYENRSFNYNNRNHPQIMGNQPFQMQANSAGNYQTHPISNIIAPTYQAQPIRDQHHYGPPLPTFNTNPQVKINFGSKNY